MSKQQELMDAAYERWRGHEAKAYRGSEMNYKTMTQKVWVDGKPVMSDEAGGVTRLSLEFFYAHRGSLGSIVRVKMEKYYTDEDEWVEFPLEIEGKRGIMRLSGCVAGYGGEGPHGTVKVLKALGYADAGIALRESSFELGTPGKEIS